jgi:hypothetical protein
LTSDPPTSEFARPEQNQKEAQDDERLLTAFVAIVGTRGWGASGSEWGRSRTLWRGVVDQCKQQHWHNWAQAVCIVATHVLPSVRGAAVTTYDDSGVTQPMSASDGWTRQVEERPLSSGSPRNTPASRGEDR